MFIYTNEHNSSTPATYQDYYLVFYFGFDEGLAVGFLVGTAFTGVFVEGSTVGGLVGVDVTGAFVGDTVTGGVLGLLEGVSVTGAFEGDAVGLADNGHMEGTVDATATGVAVGDDDGVTLGLPLGTKGVVVTHSSLPDEQVISPPFSSPLSEAQDHPTPI